MEWGMNGTSPPAFSASKTGAAPSAPRTLDMPGLARAFGRHKVLFYGVAATVLLLMLAAAFLLKPVYSATTAIRIDPSPRPPLNVELDTTREAQPDTAVVDTEVSVMKSRDVAKAVATQLKLTQLDEFKSKPNLLSQFLGPILAGNAHSVPGAALETTVDKMEKHLKVLRDGTSYVVDLTFQSKNQDLVAVIANTFADQYIARSVEARAETAARQAASLGGRLESLGREVQGADEAVARYKAAAGISTNGAAGSTVTDQQIGSLTGSLATAQSDAAAAESNLQAAQRQIATGGMESVSGVLTSPVIADLRRQRTEVVREAADVSSRYGPKHPEYQKVHQQLQDLDKQLNDESVRIVNNLQSEANANEARASSLRGELGRLAGAKATNTRASVEADALQRDADAKRTIYNQLAQSAQQNSQDVQSNDTQVRIVETATTPLTPSFPNKPLFIVLGAVLGGACGAAAVFIAEILRRGLNSADEIEDAFGIPVLAGVPELERRQLRVSGKDIRAWDVPKLKPLSAYAESLRTVRAALTLWESEKPAKVIAVTSALPGEGKTTTAVALARVMGLSGDRVILVDCDLRRNALKDLLPTAPESGLLEVLGGECGLDQAIVEEAETSLHILPLKGAAFVSHDNFGTEAMGLLIEQLCKRYTYIVLDCPSLLAVADARRLASLSDLLLMVVRWKRTPRQAVAAAINQLAQDGTVVSGVILARIDTRVRSALGAASPSLYRNLFSSYYQE